MNLTKLITKLLLLTVIFIVSFLCISLLFMVMKPWKIGVKACRSKIRTRWMRKRLRKKRRKKIINGLHIHSLINRYTHSTINPRILFFSPKAKQTTHVFNTFFCVNLKISQNVSLMNMFPKKKSEKKIKLRGDELFLF